MESGDISGILDPNLVGKFDEVEMQRMVLAVTLCITRTARLRPEMNQVNLVSDCFQITTLLTKAQNLISFPPFGRHRR